MHIMASRKFSEFPYMRRLGEELLGDPFIMDFIHAAGSLHRSVAGIEASGIDRGRCYLALKPNA